jgi:2-polyprenyl-6-methoxyphenol hydroxylase-like FAD-dependent oxidoreductase
MTSVLIVGAGPVGLTMACELVRRGIDFRIIDKAPEPSDKSKALVLHSRTLEMLEQMGLVQTFIDAGHIVYGSDFYQKDKKLLHMSFGEIEGPYPYALMLPQSETERLLREHLAKQNIQVERPVELTKFSQDKGKVEAWLRFAEGADEKVEVDYLLGCDGAHSTVRHTTGITFDGEQYAEGFATFDVHVDWAIPDEELSIFVAEEGMLACFPLGEKRYRIIANAPVEGHKTGDVLTLAEAQKFVDERGPGGVKLSDPIWMTWFTINRRSAKTYRSGNAFLIGDAAHIHSPALGQGMNTGMQDAINLAWKLDLVMRGGADAKLLDSYEVERHAVGQALLKTTDRVTKLITLRGTVAAGVRNHLMPLLASHEVVQHRAMKNISMLGVNYRHSPIVGDYHPLSAGLSNIIISGPQPGDRAPDAYIDSGTGEEVLRLFPAIANDKFNLLLFAGLKQTDDGHKSILEIARAMAAKHKGLVESHFVVAAETLPSALKSAEAAQIFFDSDQSFHHTYKAESPCLYLIRPDGYIGFRSHPPDLSHLEKHLELFSLGLSRTGLGVN